MTEEEALERLGKLLLRLLPQAEDSPWKHSGDEFVKAVPREGILVPFRVRIAENAIKNYRDTDEGRREDGDERLLDVVREALLDGRATTGRIEHLTT
jgi:hypothetical protein